MKAIWLAVVVALLSSCSSPASPPSESEPEWQVAYARVLADTLDNPGYRDYSEWIADSFAIDMTQTADRIGGYVFRSGSVILTDCVDRTWLDRTECLSSSVEDHGTSLVFTAKVEVGLIAEGTTNNYRITRMPRPEWSVTFEACVSGCDSSR